MSQRRVDNNRAPNQIDVARLAGVSAQTVSRVMSGGDNVRPATARKVLAAVEQLGYRVHAAAASLASGRTHILGFLVLSTNRYSTASIAVGIEQVATQYGYTVTTASVSDNATAEDMLEAFDRLERQGAEGIILGLPVSFDHPVLKKRAERTPSTHNIYASNVEHDDFAIDQRVVARLAVEHLLNLGHRAIWHVSGDERWNEARQRREAWETTLTEHGIDAPPVIPGDWTSESGYRAGRTIAAIPDATAVFVSSDEMAFGVLRALHEAGRTVPDDISVVSVDDIDLAAYASPALTTVKQPFEGVGAAAARRVIADIEGRAHEADDAAPTEPRLIVRASTAPPRR